MFHEIKTPKVEIKNTAKIDSRIYILEVKKRISPIPFLLMIL